jgi:Family of unknown function (DUF6263)
MKRNSSIILATLALGLAWVGCNKSGKLSETSKFTIPAGPVELKLKWPLGERVLQSLEVKQTSETTLPNTPAPMKQDMTFGQQYALTVLKDDGAGGREIEMEFLSARGSTTNAGQGTVSFDTAKKSPTDAGNPLAESLTKLVGAKLKFFLDASNVVQKVEGVDEIKNRFASGGKAGPANSLDSMFTEPYFKQMLDYSRTLPPNPVQPGDTWPVKLDVSLGNLGAMDMEYTFTFTNWEKHGKRTCARLEFIGTIKNKPMGNSNPGGMTIAVQDGNSTGVTWFDPEIGAVIDTSTSQDMRMAVTVPMPAAAKKGPAAKPLTITTVLHQVVTTKLDSVK